MPKSFSCAACGCDEYRQIVVDLPSGARRETDLFACARCRTVQYRGNVHVPPPPPRPTRPPASGPPEPSCASFLSSLGGTDIAQGSSLLGLPTAPKQERSVVIDTRYRGRVRITYRVGKFKRHKSYRLFRTANRAEPVGPEVALGPS